MNHQKCWNPFHPESWDLLDLVNLDPLRFLYLNNLIVLFAFLAPRLCLRSDREYSGLNLHQRCEEPWGIRGICLEKVRNSMFLPLMRQALMWGETILERGGGFFSRVSAPDKNISALRPPPQMQSAHNFYNTPLGQSCYIFRRSFNLTLSTIIVFHKIATKFWFKFLLYFMEL